MPLYLKTLQVLSHIGSFFYFIFDNFLWLIYSKILNFFTEEQEDQFKYVKDLGSFSRIIFNLVINILEIRQYMKRRKELVKKMLFLKSQPFEKDSEALKDLEELLEVRFELRNSWIEVVHSLVRMMMLWKSLSLLGHQKINPVTAAGIGYLSTLLGLFKTLFDSPDLMVKTIEEDTKEKSENLQLIRSMSSVFNQVGAPGGVEGIFFESHPHHTSGKEITLLTDKPKGSRGLPPKVPGFSPRSIMVRTFGKVKDEFPK